MATTTRQRKQENSTSSTSNGNARSAGMLAAAALAGAAIGFAANIGRKFVIQGLNASDDWAETLAMEHQVVLDLFDRIEGTSSHQTNQRKLLLGKLKHALGKHALEEENVIYPALRDANSTHDADTLNSEHGYVKTFLYELENMPADDARWLAKVKELRAMLEAHMKMEEEEVFPSLREALTDEQNLKLAQAMNREGMKLV